VKGTGGITQHLGTIIDVMNKKTGAVVCYDDDPEGLFDRLEGIYKDHIFPRHVRILESDSGLDGQLQS
jgi:hypothetical protein